MKKGRNNYVDELYEDDDYGDDDNYDDDDYYEEEYEEEEEKPKKNKNKNNNKNQQKNQTSNPQSKETSKINSLNISKKDSNISSSLALSNSASSSITNTSKEKEIKSIKDLNNLESYPKIDYGKAYITQEEKPTINLVIIGHVDSGKSTMVGHLLLLLGLIDKKDFQKKLKFSSQTRDTMQYAFATDESSSERERGVTIGIGYKNFSTKNRNVVILDAPGHKDFIPTMIAGSSAADYALLVIDSGLNAFDAGFYREGRTKEHALLAKTLGVSKIIVAINKLELFNWEEKRYNELVEVLNNYLIDELGFKPEDIYFIPTSGFTGDNLINPIEAKNAKWYKGPVLIDLIDSLPAPIRAVESPVRFVINDITDNPINGVKGINLYGKLDSGIIIKNKEYMIFPSLKKEKIKAMAVNKIKVDYITPGQQAEIILGVKKNEKEEFVIKPGNILCSEKFPIPCIKKFKAHIKTYNLKTPITQGQKMMLYLQEQQTQIVIKK